MRTKYTPILLIITMLFIGLNALCFSACDSPTYNNLVDKVTPNNKTSDPNSEEIDVHHNQEDDEAVIERVEADESDFYGTWVAKSDRAQYLYGNIEVTVKEDGTWTGNITDEELSGKWTAKGDHLHMNNDLFSFDLAFDKYGDLIFIDSEAEDDINIVLSKK